ncbi:hypothetical protein CRG98_034515 [Punica granatum]|uniref:Uncharacterized protein n=1 Tax=Punica granatum TaxID=22663 RepID=A0A2I0IM89_PUNGR|nr:hypothetical protein CRG98_034515 [Punica granatum]
MYNGHRVTRADPTKRDLSGDKVTTNLIDGSAPTIECGSAGHRLKRAAAASHPNKEGGQLVPLRSVGAPEILGCEWSLVGPMWE